MTTAEEIAALTQPCHPADWTDRDSRAVDTARLLAAVRNGDLTLNALYANLMSGLSESEELLRLTEYARRLRRDQRQGLPIPAQVGGPVQRDLQRRPPVVEVVIGHQPAR